MLQLVQSGAPSTMTDTPFNFVFKVASPTCNQNSLIIFSLSCSCISIFPFSSSNLSAQLHGQDGQDNCDSRSIICWLAHSSQVHDPGDKNHLKFLTISYRLLKHTLKTAKEDTKVVVVSPTTHQYWNLASVRAIVPGQIPDEKVCYSNSSPDHF